MLTDIYLSLYKKFFTIKAIFVLLACLFVPLASLQAQDLAYFTHSDKYKTLELTIEDNTLPVTVLTFASQQTLSKGVILIVADIEAAGSAQYGLIQIAKLLPQWGWNTLYVAPNTQHLLFAHSAKDPEQTEQSDSPEENPKENAETANDTENTDSAGEAQEVATKIIQAEQTQLKSFQLQAPQLNYSFEDYQVFIQKLLFSVHTEFMQQPGYKLLLMQGKSAIGVLPLLQTNEAGDTPIGIDFNGLILHNVYWPELDKNNQVSRLLAKVKLPVLDLTSRYDNQWAKNTSLKRTIDTRVSLKSLYRQRDIVGPPIGALQTEYVAKEVVGWTHYLGW